MGEASTREHNNDSIELESEKIQIYWAPKPEKLQGKKERGEVELIY